MLFPTYKTRANYHKEVRKIRLNERNIRNQRLAENINAENSRKFWSEIRRVRSNSKSKPKRIDNADTDESIAKVFSDKFSELYNCVSFDIEDMDSLKLEIANDIKQKCKVSGKCDNHMYYITVEDIRQCVNSLKPVKKDGTVNLFTDNFIHGCNRLYVLISFLFTAFLIHGYCPDSMLFGTMTPIAKVNGTTDSNNFRAITLCSIMCKLFEIVVQKKCQDIFKTSDLQLGFKSKSSTTACTFAVQEVISFYNDQKTNVYCTLLDASKGFDRLEFCTLFRKMIKRKMCPLIVRLLLYMYTNQSLVVKWNGFYSERFKVTNGVKQGGILSPSLFCIYINDLLDILKEKGIGCYIGSNYCGALSYADDLILMCPSIQGTQEMLNVCEKYANTHKIKFNVSKSQIIVFNHNKYSQKNPDIYLNNEKIPIVSEVKHLGHVLCNKNTDIIDVEYIGKCFNKSVNIMMANFKTVSSNVLSKLFISYCCNFYGLTLCNSRSGSLYKLFVLWRKAIRRIFRLPSRCHNVLLPCILGRPNLEVEMYNRICKFYYSLLNSSNILIKNEATRCLYQSTSNMGINVSYMYNKFNIDFVQDNSNYIECMCRCNSTKNSIIECALTCTELINIRDNNMMCPLTSGQCDELLQILCTDPDIICETQVT